MLISSSWWTAYNSGDEWDGLYLSPGKQLLNIKKVHFIWLLTLESGLEHMLPAKDHTLTNEIDSSSLMT